MNLHELDESLRTENPCWKGYHPVGTKKKNGRTVPNCVPESTEGVAEAYPGHIQKGKELDAATKKIQKNLDKRIKKVDDKDKKGMAEATGDSKFDAMMSNIMKGAAARKDVDTLRAQPTKSSPEAALGKFGMEFISHLEKLCRARCGPDRTMQDKSDIAPALSKWNAREDGGARIAQMLSDTFRIAPDNIKEFARAFNEHGDWPWQHFATAWTQGEWSDYKRQWTDGYLGSLGKGVAEGLNEMDKSAPQPGRDGKVSHSTYGSRDKKGSDYFKGKEAPGKAITVKKMEKDALDILKKQGVAESDTGDAPIDKMSTQELAKYLGWSVNQVEKDIELAREKAQDRARDMVGEAGYRGYRGGSLSDRSWRNQERAREEASVLYKFDPVDEKLKQKSWYHDKYNAALAAGWKESHEAAMRAHGYFPSKFKAGHYIKKDLSGKWITIYPYAGTVGESSDPDLKKKLIKKLLATSPKLELNYLELATIDELQSMLRDSMSTAENSSMPVAVDSASAIPGKRVKRKTLDEVGKYTIPVQLSNRRVLMLPSGASGNDIKDVLQYLIKNKDFSNLAKVERINGQDVRELVQTLISNARKKYLAKQQVSGQVPAPKQEIFRYQGPPREHPSFISQGINFANRAREFQSSKVD